MRLRITIINDDTCELHSTHQFTTEETLNSLKGMATVAQATWAGEASGGDHIDCPDQPVFDLLENIVEAVEEDDEK